MSRRGEQIEEYVAALGLDSAPARQVAAYVTRAAKDAVVEPAALRPAWVGRLAAVGFDRSAAEACYDRQIGAVLVTDQVRHHLLMVLGGHRRSPTSAAPRVNPRRAWGEESAALRRGGCS